MRIKYLAFLILILFSGIRTKISARQVYDYIISKNGSGDFKTIQDAITACPNYSEKNIFIFIKNGVYNEKVLIPSSKSNITFVGESVDSVVITYNDYSGKTESTGKKLETFTSYTCLIAANNITFENITFENSAGRVGQAVAVHVEGDRCIFHNCRIIGNQDTLFAAGESSRQYFLDCYIEGTTDFIFGPSTAVFERCTIKSKKNSYITAASTPATKEYGYVFFNCKLIADTAATMVHLGRPWRSYAYTTFINCEMDSHIVPVGWHNWNKPEAEKKARYYEFNSKGPGANTSARVFWSHQLTKEEAEKLTPKNILKGLDNWDPSQYYSISNRKD